MSVLLPRAIQYQGNRHPVNQCQRSRISWFVTGAIALSLVSWASLSPSVLADPPRLNSYIAQAKRVKYTLPPSRGTPKSGSRPNPGAGSRGDCQALANRPPLTRLVGSKHLNQTVSPHPTIWVYIPYSNQEVSRATLSLQDASGDEEIYTTEFQLGNQPGVVGIQVPKDAPELAQDETYVWFVSVNCPSPERSWAKEDTSPAVLQGSVKRIAVVPELQQDLSQAKTLLEQVVAYGQHHTWYDMLTQLAILRGQEPNNTSLNQIWTQLLSDEENVGLGSVAHEPIVDFITASSQPK